MLKFTRSTFVTSINRAAPSPYFALAHTLACTLLYVSHSLPPNLPRDALPSACNTRTHHRWGNVHSINEYLLYLHQPRSSQPCFSCAHSCTPLTNVSKYICVTFAHHIEPPPATPCFGFATHVNTPSLGEYSLHLLRSCCCCCSLRTGVALLAVDNLITGCFVLFIMRTFYASFFGSSLQIGQAQYAQSCEGDAASTPDCLQLKAAIEQGEGALELYRHLPSVVYVQGVFCLVTGLVGLWAVLLRSRRAAKVFMLTWPVKFVLAVVGMLQVQSLCDKYGVEQHYQGAFWITGLFFLVYYFKVSWSYYKKRLDYDNDCTRSSGNITASPDTVYRGKPMPAMNSHV